MVVAMNTSADFLHEIRAAASLMGIAPSTLCQRAVSNGKLVRRLEAGSTVTMSTVNRIRAYVSVNAPEVRRRRSTKAAALVNTGAPEVVSPAGTLA